VVNGEDFGSSSQKKLFFKLRKIKGAISALGDGDLRPDQVRTISERLKVSEREVVDMDRRLRGDVSLNARINDAPEAGDALDRLMDPSPCHDLKLAEAEELDQRREALKAAIQTLSPRERHIFTARHLTEAPPNLQTLALEYGISGERIRQIEVRAFQEVKSAMLGRESLPKLIGQGGTEPQPNALARQV
jgi:RNA polymerase sigma-32 factor